MHNFRAAVLEAVKSVPSGRVVSYGQVAAAAGSPRAARQVGGILRGMTDLESRKVPWWQVINNQGVISIKGNWTATKELQKKLLEKEKIIVSPNFTVDMKKYRHLFKL